MPWSHTTVSATITGRAAAQASRSSIATSRSCGSTEQAMRNASGQPGRIGSGVSALASSSEASTAFVVGRNTAAAIVRVATSTIIVSSARSTVPSSSTTRTSSGVESTGHHSPGRSTVTAPNGPSGRCASDRRVGAEPNVCRPAAIRATSR
jgi:hypothetical protein